MGAASDSPPILRINKLLSISLHPLCGYAEIAASYCMSGKFCLFSRLNLLTHLAKRRKQGDLGHKTKNFIWHWFILNELQMTNRVYSKFGIRLALACFSEHSQ